MGDFPVLSANLSSGHPSLLLFDHANNLFVADTLTGQCMLACTRVRNCLICPSPYPGRILLKNG